jgi:hypothetical protein
MAIVLCVCVCVLLMMMLMMIMVVMILIGFYHPWPAQVIAGTLSIACC